jgi:thiamine pyrophosphate-dependent acetolactate synthase large subunit-like protein
VRGEAYLAPHEGNEAAGEFQKIIGYPPRTSQSTRWHVPNLYKILPVRKKGNIDETVFISGASVANGLPYTIAAQVAHPDRQCIAFVGTAVSRC